jgi:hypothetical protein
MSLVLHRTITGADLHNSKATGFTGDPASFTPTEPGVFYVKTDVTPNVLYRSTGTTVGALAAVGSADDSEGVTDHGALTGLSDDDHTQYFNTTRGDARYQLKSDRLAEIAALTPSVTGQTIEWSGSAWVVGTDDGGVSSLNSLSGALTIANGSNITVTPSGSTITIGTTGLLVAANNLSDLPSAATARTNLGVAIGTNVQAYSARLSELAALTPTTGQVPKWSGSAWVAGDDNSSSSTGTVTSVALSAPTFLTVSGSPVTTSGTLTLTLANQSMGTVFAGPAASTGAPTFRSLVASDIPAIAISGVTNLQTALDAKLAIANNLSELSASASTVRGNLGVVIGTDVQAYSARLADIAALTPTSGKVIKGNGATWVVADDETGGGGVAGVSSLNALTGALAITAGSNISVTPSGSTIAIAVSNVGIVWAKSATPGSTTSFSLTTLSTVTIPAGTLQSGDLIEVIGFFAGTGGGSKSYVLSIGGTTVFGRSPTSNYQTFRRVFACGTNTVTTSGATTTEPAEHSNSSELSFSVTFSSGSFAIDFRGSCDAGSSCILRGGIVRVLRAP